MRNTRPPRCLRLAGIAAGLLAGGAAAQTVAPTIEVVATTPVAGLDQRRDEIPSPVRSIDRRSLRDSASASVTELLNSRVNGVTVNETQGNPFQADVNFRGFTASPLLGTPQGLSVYQDGVRINEAFGDIVNWDLVPKVAIERIDLIPGANPLFGLNTLGGALSVQTKSGFSAPGTGLELSAGSFGRRSGELEFGGVRGDLGIYAAGTWFKEDGWRDFSPSEVKQVFARLSRRSARVDLDLSLTHADTDLIGNGLVPGSMQSQGRATIFTKPDNTLNRMTMLALNSAYWLDDTQRLSATVYWRGNTTRTVNGDTNNDFEGDAALDGAAGANGGVGVNSETALSNRTRTRQRAAGAAVQWASIGEHAQTAVGATHDRSRSAFSQSHEVGVFDSQRGVVPAAGELDDNRLSGRTEHSSVFATHTFRPLAGLAATLSGRYNRTRVKTVDELNPGVAANLDGDFVYRKFNPSAGFTYAVTPALTTYANAAQGNRAPSPIELGCADPNNPCSLPNAMQADPFLKQVVTRSVDFGVRGQLGTTQWNAGVFAANNYDDILFVGTSASRGYFTNFGSTRRAGVELGASGSVGAVSWRAQYGYLRATYRSSACLLAANNSSRGQSPACTDAGSGAGDDLILVSPGNRLPGVPAHSLKLGADWQASERWTLSTELHAYSSQYVRGNENNAHQAGSFSDIAGGGPRTFVGAGKLGGYGVVNFAAKNRLGAGWEGFARITNVFDRRYASGGALGENPFSSAGVFQTNSDDWRRETFYAPGAPRAAWIGIRYLIGGR